MSITCDRAGVALARARSRARAWRRGRWRWPRRGRRRPRPRRCSASTPLGTSAAITGRARAVEVLDDAGGRRRAARRWCRCRAARRRARPRRRARAAVVARAARRPAAAPSWAPASRLERVRLGRQQHVGLAPGAAQQPRGDEPVAAVVALPAHDRDPARTARSPRSRRARPSPARSIRSSDGIPRDSIAHASVARICAASGSGSSQRGRLTAGPPRRRPCPWSGSARSRPRRRARPPAPRRAR